MADTTTPSLKRLGFVAQYAGTAAGMTENVYKKARAYTPAFAEPYVRQAEDTATQYGAPYLNWAQDTSEKVLRGVDAQVDYFTNAVYNSVDYSRDLHDKNLKTFGTAKDTYFGYVEKLVASVKETLNPSPYVTAAANTLQAALDKATKLADPDLAVDTVHDAWIKFSSISPVAKILELTDPVYAHAQDNYKKVHDTVVAMPVYKRTYDTVTKSTAVVTENYLYKKAKEVVYPVVAPVADPVYANFEKSKYVKQLTEHLKPAVA